MSRTTLCVITAIVLAALAVGSMIFRYQILGEEIHTPTGPGVWKVTLSVHGTTEGNGRLYTLTPLDTEHQRVLRESCSSSQLIDKPIDTKQVERHPERRSLTWAKRPTVGAGEFHAYYQFFVTREKRRTPSFHDNRDFTVAPRNGEYLESLATTGPENEKLTQKARELTENISGKGEQAEALYCFVSKRVHREPATHVGSTGSAIECLEEGAGDARAQSRLLVALLRSRGIPARVIAGLHLVQDENQPVHYWVEAWLLDHWLAMCPYHHHYGHVPSSYLIFAYGDHAIVRGKHLSELDYSFSVEKTSSAEAMGADEPPSLKKTLRALRLTMLPSAEQHLVEFLLLLPIAALIICVYRNLIGIYSFGTFAPALVGLAFRDLHSLPGLLVFVSILLVGWLMRRLLDRYHLLQVPRIALMLSMVVFMLVALIVGAHFRALEATRYISLFPMVILTGMIERFWTLETEDGTTASFKTLLATLLISGTIAGVLSLHFVVYHMLAFPETLGVIMALQLLIGRYTGYRFMELFRFRDFLQQKPHLRLHTLDAMNGDVRNGI